MSKGLAFRAERLRQWMPTITISLIDPPDASSRSLTEVQRYCRIATSFLIASLHAAGLATLTHTPSPMGFINEICGRPETEKPYIPLVVGYLAESCTVPVHGGIKNPLEKIASWL